MRDTYGDTINADSEQTGLDFIRDVIIQPANYWKQGCGDSSIKLGVNNFLIFFKTEQGIFIQHLPTYNAPLIQTNYAQINTITHYCGGEPMDVPDICLCNEEVSLDIFKYFINTGELYPEYKWVDIFDYIKYRYAE